MSLHPKHVPFEYSRITPQIYIGTNQCCEGHFSSELLQKGIKGDLSLEGEKIDAAFGVEYYMWLPVKDRTAPTQQQFYMGILYLDSVLNMKKKIYVHCKNGHGRAPTLVAAYFVTQGMSTDEAFAFIKKRRSTIHPNKQQVASVKEFEKTYKPQYKLLNAKQ